MEIQKIPPSDVDIEQAVLGAILLEPNAISVAQPHLTPDKFYDPKHKLIYQAILDLYANKEPIDLLTCMKQIRKNDKLTDSGGPTYISQLTNRVASSANLESWCLTISELYLKRELARIALQLHDASYDMTADVFDTYNDVMHELGKAHSDNVKNQSLHVSSLMKEATVNVESRLNSDSAISGYSTGIHEVDLLLGGHQKSDLMYMAGRPGMGKTAMAISEILHLAKQNTPVAFFSLEMSATQIIFRLSSMICGVNSERLMKYKLDTQELTRYYQSVDVLNTLPIYIDDTPALSVYDLRSKVKQLQRKHGVEIVYIDYVQLMQVGSVLRKNGMSREQELSTISRNLKLIAKECNIPVIALSQLSRGVESRQDKRPVLADLRESGSLEQDADVVVFLFRPEYYNLMNDEDGSSTEGLGEYIIAKQRNGGTGIRHMKFHHELMLYTDFNTVVKKYNDERIQKERWDL